MYFLLNRKKLCNAAKALSYCTYHVNFRVRSARMSVEFGIKIGLDCKDDWTRAARIDDMAVSQ